MLTTPWEKDTTTVSYHDALAAHPDQATVAAVLLHFGYLLLLGAALALYVLARHAAPKLATAGGIPALIGLSTLPGLLPLASGTGLVPAAAGAALIALALALSTIALRLAQPRLRANSPKIASASAA
jgi:hypothetical protein